MRQLWFFSIFILRLGVVSLAAVCSRKRGYLHSRTQDLVAGLKGSAFFFQASDRCLDEKGKKKAHLLPDESILKTLDRSSETLIRPR